MMELHAEYLAEIADALDTAPREGTPADEPEGNRYITLSDTLARQLAQRLREIAGEIESGILSAATIGSHHGNLHIAYDPIMDAFNLYFLSGKFVLTSDALAHLVAGRSRVYPIENGNTQTRIHGRSS